MSDISTPHSQQAPPLWRNTTVLKWTSQVITLAVIIAVGVFLFSQAKTNLDAKDIPVGFDWINDPANIQPGEGIDTTPDSMGRALWVGMVNTLRMAGVGILFATILGTVVGLARLSNNWVANKAASAFVETLRNIPVLVQILLWFAIVSAGAELGDLQDKNAAGETLDTSGWVFFSNKGLSVPRVFYGPGFYQWLAMMIIFCTGIFFVRKKLLAKQEAEGGDHKIGLKLTALLVAAAAIAWFANGIMAFLGGIFQGISDAWGSIPQAVMQLIITGLFVFGAGDFIRRFLNSRRTPAGLAKLTDDDYFRMIFAGVAALLGAVLIWVVWPGLSSWFVNSGSDFWQWLADKFGDGRGTKPFDAMKPTIPGGRFANYGPQGLTMTTFFAALFFGLVFYTASFIAEIVRGGVLAVAKGQTEAAAALGLSRMQALRKVILPQAFRVIMPPLGNQYLNLTKNTSLGIAVGYSEVVQVGQTLGNKNNQFLAIFAIFMAFFLVCSLSTSAVVNYINNKLAIVER